MEQLLVTLETESKPGPRIPPGAARPNNPWPLFGLKLPLRWPMLPPSCLLQPLTCHLVGHLAAKLLQDASMRASSGLRGRFRAFVGASGGAKTKVFLRFLKVFAYLAFSS